MSVQAADPESTTILRIGGERGRALHHEGPAAVTDPVTGFPGGAGADAR